MPVRATQREDRRRRVMRDETRTSGPPRRRRATGNGERVFADSALESNQPRITDLLPQRKLALFKAFAFGAGMIGVVLTTFVVREQHLLRHPTIRTDWLNLQGGQTLMSSVAAMMLATATLAAALVFHIRRHQMDDYRGRYRMWYPVIGVLAMAALDVQTAAHQSLQDAVGMMTILPPRDDPNTWWVAAWSLVGTLLMIRTLVDVRRCRGAFLLLLASSAVLITAALLRLNMMQVPSAQAHRMALASCFLFGLHFLVFGLVWYARHLFLLAQGARSSTRLRVSAVVESDVQDTAGKKNRKLRLPGLGSWTRRSADPTSLRQSSKAADDDGDPSASSEDFTEAAREMLNSTNLTNSERRKLKKQLKQRNRQAA